VNGLTEPAAPVAPPRSRAPRLADLVQGQIARLVERGEFPRGCKLPTEGELSARFGISRPVLREALRALRDAGVLRSQRGSGTVVVEGALPGAAAMPPVRSVADLLRLYEFRITLEGSVAALAAERHTRETLAGIADALRQAEEAARGEAPPLLLDLNFAFHRAVARATQNPFHLAAVEALPNFVGRGGVEASSFGDQDVAVRAARIRDEHEVIYDAIRVRDGARAQAEMVSHIVAARDHVVERQTLS
jgi:DNA-binding FadR family transcriptional regulator